MINRPKNLELIECSLFFNELEFNRVEIDLFHINRHERSALKAHEAYLILEQIINGLVMNPIDERTYIDGHCRYYQETAKAYGKWYKIIFCICSDRPNAIGLITLFRVKEKK